VVGDDNGGRPTQGSPVDDPKRSYLLDTTVRGLLAVGLYVSFPAFSDIYRLWERFAGNPAFSPSPFEYPPLSALYFEPLKLLPSSRWAVLVNGLVMTTAAVAVTWLLFSFARRTGPERPDVGLWAASPALLFLLPINWDVLVILVAALGVLALYRSEAVRSGAWLGLGTAFKVFPGAAVIPVLPLITGWKKRLAFLVSAAAALAVPYVVYQILQPDTWRFHLQVAAERGDIGSSVWGVFDWLAGLLGFDLPLSAINVAAAVSLVVGLLAVTIWAARSRPSFARVAALAVVVFVIANKVFKPQYVLWPLPFLAWSGIRRGKVRAAEATAIAQFGLIYLTAPTVWLTWIAAVRVVILAAVARDLIVDRRGDSDA
jgi:uncharacterized membrane protein